MLYALEICNVGLHDLKHSEFNSMGLPKVSGHCDNTMLAITTSVDMKKIQNSEIYQPAKNCKEKCGGGYAACDDNEAPYWGSCWSDCDCSACAPYCSAISIDSFGYCQQTAG